MTTLYRRVHLESRRTIIEEVTEEFSDRSIKVMTEENGRTPAVVFFSAATLEEAQESADAVVQNEHRCDDLCGNWTRVQSAGGA
jgi:hypothetical protein